MKTKTFTSILLGTAMGAILFLYLYGTAVLVPTYDAWLLNGEDLNQHYLGWEFYRNSPWTFPVGLIQGLTVEPVSVIYTDSIPLLALIFKVLSPVLPETFQYFGLFGIGCFCPAGSVWGIDCAAFYGKCGGDCGRYAVCCVQLCHVYPDVRTYGTGG